MEGALKAGDRVSYSRVFCRNVGLTGPFTEREGTVLRVVVTGGKDVARVLWDGTEDESAVLPVNLRRLA